MFLFLVPADIALDVATPDEVAATLLLHFPDARLVTAAAAEQPATVDAGARPIANSSSRPQDVQPEKIENNSGMEMPNEIRG